MSENSSVADKPFYSPNPQLPMVASIFPTAVQTVKIVLNLQDGVPQSFSYANNPVDFKGGQWSSVFYVLDNESAGLGYYILGFFANTAIASRPLPPPPQHGRLSPRYPHGHAAQYLMGQACADGTSYAIANCDPYQGHTPEATSIIDVSLAITNVTVPFGSAGKIIWFVDPQDADTGTPGGHMPPTLKWCRYAPIAKF